MLRQTHRGAPWLGPCSVVQYIGRLMGLPLSCSAANAGMWGERDYGDGSTRHARLSSFTLLPWLPAFPPQAFPTTASSLTSPLSVSPQPTQPGTAPQSLNSSSSCFTFRVTGVPTRGKNGCGKDGLILVLFRLPQISCLTLSLKCFSSDPDSCPMWRLDPGFSSPAC